MENFETFGLRTELLSALSQLGFSTPTPIQAAAIPVALSGKDIMGTAQTGTGKTGAFGIPLISHLLENPRNAALVMTPTRELATQVAGMLQKMLGPRPTIGIAVLIGGEPIFKQVRQLQGRPRLIVGTPGRINDHLQRRSLKLKDVHFLVLDETDRMLDMGFGVQIDKILPHLAAERQTLLFSATLPPGILKLSEKYLKAPVRLAIGTENAPAARVKQETIELSEGEKYTRLLTELDQREGAILVFVKTKWGADKMAKSLRALHHAADAIHGDLRQNHRDRAIRNFRSGKNRIMVATDVAARGLDIPHIEHVINYDLPQCPEDYIHRIGRTARAGAEGAAINLVSPDDRRKWKAICRLLNPQEHQKRERPPSSHKRSGSKPSSSGRFEKSSRGGKGYSSFRTQKGRKAVGSAA